MEMNGNVNRVFVSSDSPTGHFPWLPHCRWDIPGVSSKCCRVTSVNRAGDRTAMPEDAARPRLLPDRRYDRYLPASKDSRSAHRSAGRWSFPPKQILHWQPLKELTKEPGTKYRRKSARRCRAISRSEWFIRSRTQGHHSRFFKYETIKCEAKCFGNLFAWKCSKINLESSEKRLGACCRLQTL